MKFRSRTKIILLILLVTLNIALRIPSIPHESGWDSFSTHILANSISNFGNARWWINSLSIFGYYPDSYPSGIPFILSGLSQTTTVVMEHSIWLFSLLIGILSIFISYLLADEIKNDDLFKFLVAFVFSSSQGILTFSTWDISTRGPFIILLPLFIYLLIKVKKSLKNLILSIIMLILLTSIHHLVITTIIFIFPIIVLFVIYIITSKLNIKLNIKFGNALIFILFLVVFIYSFNSNLFIEKTIYSSKYAVLIDAVKTSIRYMGPLMIFALGGFVYQVFKKNKTFAEKSIMLSLLLSIPLFFYPRYGIWVTIILYTIFITQGLSNFSYNCKSKYVLPIICFVLIVSVGFSAYYQYWRTSTEMPLSFNRYLTENSFSSALWIKDYINGNMVGNDVEATRIFAISQVPTFVGLGDIDLTYGFENIKDLNITKISSLSFDYYAEGPYIRTPNTPYSSFYVSRLNGDAFDGRWGRDIISKFNISYLIDNKLTINELTLSVRGKRDAFYDNGKIQIWSLK